jgi:hypothetical protein
MIKTDMLNSFDIVVICSLNFIHVETITFCPSYLVWNANRLSVSSKKLQHNIIIKWINVRENRKGNQEWQHWVHKKQDLSYSTFVLLMLRLLIEWMIKTDMLNSFDIVVICSLNFIHVETDIVVYDKIHLFTVSRQTQTTFYHLRRLQPINVTCSLSFINIQSARIICDWKVFSFMLCR